MEAKYLEDRTDLVRRALEFIFILISLPYLLPVLIVVAILIKLDSQGPVFYKGKRVGKDGKIFNIYKFRTLNPGTEQQVGANLLDTNSNHFTRVGKVLRKTKIDELPQLINVFKGKMSLVGPRANRPIYFAHWDKLVSGYSKRLKVKPGLTGLAQIYGDYYTHPKNKLKYDLLYIKNRSLALDLKLIILTVLILLFGKKRLLGRKAPSAAQKLMEWKRQASLAELKD